MLIARGKSITLDFVEQVWWGTINGRKLFAFDTKLRKSRKQSPGVGMPWIKENLIGHTDFNDLPCIHDGYAVSNIGDHTQVVGDIDDRHVLLFLKAADQVQNLGLNCDVQCSCWLITDQNLWLAGNCNGNDNALAHATGKLMRILLVAAFRVLDTDCFQNPECFQLGGPATQSLMEFNGFLNLVSDGFKRVQTGHRILSYHGNFSAADFQPVFFSKLSQVLSVILNTSVGDSSILVQHADKTFREHAFATA